MSATDTITQALESGMLREYRYSWTYCPACCTWISGLMNVTDYSDAVTVFLCPECNGHWFTDEHGMLWYEQLTRIKEAITDGPE